MGRNSAEPAARGAGRTTPMRAGEPAAPERESGPGESQPELDGVPPRVHDQCYWERYFCGCAASALALAPAAVRSRRRERRAGCGRAEPVRAAPVCWRWD